MDKRMNERGFRILDALEKVAADNKVILATVAVAWVMSRPAVTSPIVSATNLNQLNEVMAAAELQLDIPTIEFLNHSSGWS